MNEKQHVGPAVNELDRPDSVFHTVESLTPIAVEPGGLRLRTSATGRSWGETEVRGSRFMKSEPVASVRQMNLAVDFIDPCVIRVRWTVEGNPAALPQDILVHQPEVVPAHTARSGTAPLHCLRDMGPGRGQQMGNVDSPFVELEGHRLRVRVWTNPYRLEVFESESGDRVFGADGPEQTVFRQNDDPGLSVVVGESPSRHLFTTAFDLGHDEAIYGYGERFDSFGRQTRDVLLWQCDALGTTTGRSYKNVPFFVSDQGYGVFLHTAGAVRAWIGNRAAGRHVICMDDDVLEYFIIYGPSPTEVLGRYAALTGHAPVLPFWSFGVWMSRLTYKTQEEVEGVVAEMRRRDMGMDVIHLDPGWMDAIDWRCTLRFDPVAFPEPALFMQRLREQGVRVCLWQLPYVERESPLHGELQKEKAFALGDSFSETIIDYSSPTGLAALRHRFLDLFKLGVSVIKTDFGEEVPMIARLAGGPGRFMHNLYPLVYNQAVFNFTQEGTGQGIVWARSAWAGSQRYPLHWGGDATSNWANLAAQIVGGLNFGMSGFTYWSTDIAGISGEPTPALYVRWAQVGMLSSHVRFHSGYPVEPWNYGHEAERIVHDWIDLRYRLLPYLYGQARQASLNGLPLLRPLFLQYPHDRNARDLSDQYLLGTDLLVAPIMGDRHERDVYLPAGDWYELFTGRLHRSTGQWVRWSGDLATLPVYVRGGAVLPLGPSRRSTQDAPNGPLTLVYYPGPASTSYLSEPGEDAVIQAEVTQGRLSLAIDGRRPGRDWILALGGMQVGFEVVEIGSLLSPVASLAVVDERPVFSISLSAVRTAR